MLQKVKCVGGWASEPGVKNQRINGDCVLEKQSPDRRAGRQVGGRSLCGKFVGHSVGGSIATLSLGSLEQFKLLVYVHIHTLLFLCVCVRYRLSRYS